ncbi:hypothetical protein L2E82_09946 [Cichorium intybus]|uniref:Uncharacterized protein n=1 Tax=Cichorium intybus TaxID=13427 RepID=A0ACB9GAG2_CICIN|nr:hypothetical protein L2E82_09946 [Cichorium intybus]
MVTTRRRTKHKSPDCIAIATRRYPRSRREALNATTQLRDQERHIQRRIFATRSKATRRKGNATESSTYQRRRTDPTKSAPIQRGTLATRPAPCRDANPVFQQL